MGCYEELAGHCFVYRGYGDKEATKHYAIGCAYCDFVCLGICLFVNIFNIFANLIKGRLSLINIIWLLVNKFIYCWLVVGVAQLVRASVCGTGCRRFNSGHPPQENF